MQAIVSLLIDLSKIKFDGIVLTHRIGLKKKFDELVVVVLKGEVNRESILLAAYVQIKGD